MDTFGRDAGQGSTGGDARPAPGSDSPADLAEIFNYPSLGKLFDDADPRALGEMRERLTRTGQDLERVVRQGPKEDAERAARAVRAVNLTLEFLGDLEKLRREGGAK